MKEYDGISIILKILNYKLNWIYYKLNWSYRLKKKNPDINKSIKITYTVEILFNICHTAAWIHQ